MDALIILGLFWLAYLAVSLGLAIKNRESAESWFKTIQVICVVGAFVLGAYWYFMERKGLPHANIAQTTHVYQVSSELVAVEVHTTIENRGSQLLRLRHARVALQLVSPGQYDYEALWALKGDAYWDAVKPGERLPDGAPNRFFHRGELRWFPVRTFDRPINHDIEPGETDLLVTTFLVRCNANIVRIATDIEKRPSSFERFTGQDPLSWKARTFTDLRRACSNSPDAGAEGRQSTGTNEREAQNGQSSNQQSSNQ
jgi:hypothetical protein